MEKEFLIKNIENSNLADADKQEIIRLIHQKQYTEVIKIIVRICGIATNILHLFSIKET